jgi:hypothetical protein
MLCTLSSTKLVFTTLGANSSRLKYFSSAISQLDLAYKRDFISRAKEKVKRFKGLLFFISKDSQYIVRE